MIQDFTLIHIGKCGGTTAVHTFRENNISFERKHLCEVQYENHKKYVILIRNPISRFVSAFNWRKYKVLGEKSQEQRFSGESQLISKFNEVNNLAEVLYDKDGIMQFDLSKHYIHHIREDISFYTSKLLKNCKKEDFIKVILTETIREDMKNLFGINELNFHSKNNREKYSTRLSETGYKNLKKYLEKDYQCIERLFELEFISNYQYEILSK